MTNRLSGRNRFAIGAMGAIAPELIRWYNAVRLPPQEDGFTAPEPVLLYIGISVLFMLFAGGFTSLWEENNKVKCFYLGGSLPTFVSFMLAQAPGLPTP